MKQKFPISHYLMRSISLQNVCAFHYKWFLVILLLFGAKKLPELARGLGKGINEFKDAVETGKQEIMDASDVKKESEKEEE